MEIVTLAGNFATLNELQLYCDAQYRSLAEAGKEIERLQIEVIHLKKLLTSTVPLIAENPVDQIVVSDGQAVCEIEIRRLKAITVDRSLTMEETKRLDLLMKNLYLAKSRPADINAMGGEIDEAKLLTLATRDEQNQ